MPLGCCKPSCPVGDFHSAGRREQNQSGILGEERGPAPPRLVAGFVLEPSPPSHISPPPAASCGIARDGKGTNSVVLGRPSQVPADAKAGGYREVQGGCSSRENGHYMEGSVAVQLGGFMLPRARNYLEAAWAVPLLAFLGEAGQRSELIIAMQDTYHPKQVGGRV